MSKSKTQIAKARAGLIIDQPFFASLLLPMPISEDKSISTFATDGESIIYNPDWADTLTQQETTFVMAHETLHCVFDHMGRRGNRTPNRWNQAADYVINELLVKERIGVMPKGGLKDSALYAKGGETAEGIYKLLPPSSEKNKPGKSGGSLDDVIDGKIVKDPKGGANGGGHTVQPLDPAERQQKSADIKVRVIQARNAAKMQGALSSGIEKFVADLVKPIVDWREVLRRFVTERAKTDYSFARPKRRFLGEDLYLPSLSGEKMGSITVAVDCSGSVSKELLSKFASEVNAIKHDVHPSRIDVVYFHHQVSFFESFEAEQDVVFREVETGGTAFSPVFKYIGSQLEQPVAVVFLTDLECSDFGPAPEYPVLWTVLEGVRKGYDKVPFGEVVAISKDGE